MVNDSTEQQRIDFTSYSLCNAVQCILVPTSPDLEDQGDNPTILGLHHETEDQSWKRQLAFITAAGSEVSAAAAATTTALSPSGMSMMVSLSFTTWVGLITIVLLLMTALGNTLVCIAIASDKRLQNMTNYFLMSLAVTDFMVALLVMPFGILVVVKGKKFLGHTIATNGQSPFPPSLSLSIDSPSFCLSLSTLTLYQ